MMTLKATCFSNHTYQWNSQPELHNKPAGDIFIPAASVITGSSYESTKQFATETSIAPNRSKTEGTSQIRSDKQVGQKADRGSVEKGNIIPRLQKPQPPGQITTELDVEANGMRGRSEST